MWIILSEFKGFCMFIRLKLLLPLANSLIFTQLNWIRFHLAPCLSIYFNAQVPCIRNLTWTRWTWTISWSLIEFADQQLTRFFFHPFGLGRFSMELNGFCVPVRIDRVTQYCYVLFFVIFIFLFLLWRGTAASTELGERTDRLRFQSQRNPFSERALSLSWFEFGCDSAIGSDFHRFATGLAQLSTQPDRVRGRSVVRSFSFLFFFAAVLSFAETIFERPGGVDFRIDWRPWTDWLALTERLLDDTNARIPSSLSAAVSGIRNVFRRAPLVCRRLSHRPFKYERIFREKTHTHARSNHQ